ncbi:hypothetical protein GALMADRAFT_254520, partial [Galerina marginata CBS 339.88]
MVAEAPAGLAVFGTVVEANTSVITNVRDDVRVVSSATALLRPATDDSQLVVRGTSAVSHDAWYIDFGGVSGGEAEAE